MRKRDGAKLSGGQPAPKVPLDTRQLAERIVRSVYASTDGQARAWRMLSGIKGAGADVVQYAVRQGWIELQGNHIVCLTEEGRRLIAREAN